LTDILGKGDFFIVIVDYFVHRPSLSDFVLSKSVAAHGVVAGGFLPVAFSWCIAVGTCVGIFCH
jgi:hypothetical protein